MATFSEVIFFQSHNSDDVPCSKLRIDSFIHVSGMKSHEISIEFIVENEDWISVTVNVFSFPFIVPTITDKKFVLLYVNLRIIVRYSIVDYSSRLCTLAYL